MITVTQSVAAAWQCCLAVLPSRSRVACDAAISDGAIMKSRNVLIDSAGLYIAQDQGLFAAQGLHVKIVPVPVNTPPPSTQDLVDGQEKGLYDITAGDYVTYIEDQLGAGAPKADLRIIAESSFLQP